MKSKRRYHIHIRNRTYFKTPSSGISAMKALYTFALISIKLRKPQSNTKPLFLSHRTNQPFVLRSLQNIYKMIIAMLKESSVTNFPKKDFITLD